MNENQRPGVPAGLALMDVLFYFFIFSNILIVEVTKGPAFC